MTTPVPYEHISDNIGRCPCAPEIYVERESVSVPGPFGLYIVSDHFRTFIVHGEESHSPRRRTATGRRPRLANPRAVETHVSRGRLPKGVKLASRTGLVDV